MKSPSVAILIYAAPGAERNALTEEKYKELGKAFIENGFSISSVCYHDSIAEEISQELKTFDAVLVWVNPIEQGNDRERLDTILSEVSDHGVFVSTLPDIILKMGTKLVLYETRKMDWAASIKLYNTYNAFKEKFPGSLDQPKIIKQYRGNGGNGVFRIAKMSDQKIEVVHAQGNNKKKYTVDEFLTEFNGFFENGGLLIEQPWNENISSGMVRCYMSGTKVAGFGYQEINALYQDENGNYVAPGKRYYYTENCSLFRDLKSKMEKDWIPQLQKVLDIPENKLPVIWDADFFINDPCGFVNEKKYELCEINVSCVSPFPPSSINFIVETVRSRLDAKKLTNKAG